MDQIRLAYRDDDRTPMIFCIAEMARRHYDVDVDVVQIRDTPAFESALFDGTADVLIEHTEYLYAYTSAPSDQRCMMFCAPVVRTGLELVVGPEVSDLTQLYGRPIAVRYPGRPTATLLRMEQLGLIGHAEPVIVSDADVGRWSQWKKVQNGECGGAFLSVEYLPPALDAGLKVLPVADVPVVGYYAHGCLADLGYRNPGLLKRYVSAVIHAACLMKLRPNEALEIAAGEPARRMKLANGAELARRMQFTADMLQVKPYPSPEGLGNSQKIAAEEFPGCDGVNPLALWDLHWVKQLDDEGFIDGLVERLRSAGGSPAAH
ncbi:MAG: hypothetical protein QOF51_991 [Chloroflexota bacterium]|jgi:hypothetical protein|nr:hypothetical protein [Chloroflexota bacterium]